MTRVTPARRAALSVLIEAFRRDARVRDLLGASGTVRALDAREAAFARRLAVGTVACAGCLDDALDAYLERPRSGAPEVRAALRLSAYELLYLGTAPEVAVSQGVELARGVSRGAAGLANAVLRRVADGREGFLVAVDAAEDQRAIVSRARGAGLPVWLVREVERSLGLESAEGFLAAQGEPAPIAVRFARAGSADRYAGFLAEEPLFPGDPCSRRVVDMPGLVASGVFERDEAVVSDANAQQVALEAANRGGSLLEVGAGRGTKTYVLASRNLVRRMASDVVSVDLHEVKCRQNLERLGRAGLDAGIRVLAGDATDLDAVLAPVDTARGEHALFDTVLLDAPCSGTGTLRRHPEICWRITPREVRRDLPALQLALLAAAAGRVAAGGALIYATCSVLDHENDSVVQVFLKQDGGRGFELATRCQTAPAPGAFDGHYHAVLRRRA